VYQAVRDLVPALDRDVPLSGFIESLVPLVRRTGCYLEGCSR